VVAVAAVGVGLVTRRARPFSVYGRLVGTDAEIAADLGIPLEVVLRAVHEARLGEWGRNGAGAPVWEGLSIGARAERFLASTGRAIPAVMVERRAAQPPPPPGTASGASERELDPAAAVAGVRR